MDTKDTRDSKKSRSSHSPPTSVRSPVRSNSQILNRTNSYQQKEGGILIVILILISFC